MGGAEFFEALVHHFYEGVAADPVLRAMYPEEDLAPAERRLRLFLTQYWGGPTTYSDERGHPRLRMRHNPYVIDDDARDRWLDAMRAALDLTMAEQELDPSLGAGALALPRRRGHRDGQRRARRLPPPRRTHDAPGAAVTIDLPVREGNAGIPPRKVRDWWRDAVVYQIYPRSFSDSDGDGLGDIPGVRARLPYLRDLGVDAVWLSPFYPSPLLDGGYDVADPRDVDPRLGTLDDMRALVTEAHDLGLRVFVDVVPNHFSWDHAVVQGRARDRARVAGVEPLPREVRQGRERRAAAEQLAERVRRPGVVADPRPPRLVVPPPVRLLAARRELGQPGGPRRLREDAALLVRHGRRRLPHRRRALAHQGRRAARRPGARRPDPRRQRDRPGVGPARRARGLARVASGRRLLRAAARLRRRGVGRDDRGAGGLHPSRRAAHHLQLPLPQGLLGRRGHPRRHRHLAADVRRPSARRPPGCCRTTTSGAR